MQIFAIIAPEDSAALEAAIEEKFPENFYKIGAGQFLISVGRAMTTTKVSEHIGLSGGRLGRAAVFHISNWNGWHNKDIWEWLNSQTAAVEHSEPKQPDV